MKYFAATYAAGFCSIWIMMALEPGGDYTWWQYLKVSGVGAVLFTVLTFAAATIAKGPNK